MSLCNLILRERFHQLPQRRKLFCDCTASSSRQKWPPSPLTSSFWLLCFTSSYYTYLNSSNLGQYAHSNLIVMLSIAYKCSISRRFCKIFWPGYSLITRNGFGSHLLAAELSARIAFNTSVLMALQSFLRSKHLYLTVLQQLFSLKLSLYSYLKYHSSA